ncbi:acyl-CoA dehydrogenase-like protein [Rubrobacter xylanophilus DSM 9941]|mgnify:CR=1 FL=1|uniref:Acyl-CoA dehydrogenase-like protein n=1 Tax=Rubrobacter xylanophilus (strain DSM 9941 / JCM 11954 / NBRC 16129 / PRD-1) TaxID=266117 RepID=Q1AZ27_RUBXD|nr:acyl-CoA dehydrogenase family protein [Rubrobacter xylanophilus]ABG03351.1 acyl-CoA dehydrogenase-like protein [Rubrobacter xylanophilus DSM 9941]
MVPDYYLLDELLTGEERAVRERVRAFVDREVLPVIGDYWERGEPPFELLPKLAELKLAGGTIEGYGCPGLSAVAAGLVTMELSRGDGGLNIFFGGTSSLVMPAIYMLGSEEQRERWLPPMARLEKLGAFALTEPEHGSDAVALETRARRRGEGYVIDGRKRWVGNASFADVILVWARDDEGEVGAFVVERGAPGLSARVMAGKTAVRSSWQAEVELSGVEVPAENRLERARSFRDASRVLAAMRYGAAWAALGHAAACYEAALAHARERRQFGRPLVSFQLVQKKLAGMLAEITSMQLLCLRLSRLADQGKMTGAMASLAKMNNARKARGVCLEARDILGGNGLLLEHHVARHAADIEAVYTYEGTDDINALIVGRDITGVSAFA